MNEKETKVLAHALVSALELGMQKARQGCSIIAEIPSAIFEMGGKDIQEKAAKMQAAARVLLEAMNETNAAAAAGDRAEMS